MDGDEKVRLRRLLLELRRANLDRPMRRPTFMEVAGVERREVTVSKILAFFLDSGAEHGMGDLWLSSPLSAAALGRRAVLWATWPGMPLDGFVHV